MIKEKIVIPRKECCSPSAIPYPSADLIISAALG
jgi:hypothetical protein